MPSWVSQGYEDYARRLPHECSLRLVEIPLGRRSRTQPSAQAVEEESRRMLAAIPERSLVVALDVGGRAWDTSALAVRLQEWLQQDRKLDPGFVETVFTLDDDEAIRHIFRVACGLDSMVLGEPQILGQLKDAFRYAQQADTLGSNLSRLFQHTFSVAKKVRTDTEIGKTVVTLGLIRWLQGRGLRVAAMKPVASGCERTLQGLRNDDALQLQQQASMPLGYDEVNPYAFEPPIAPHIAAAQAGEQIELDRIRRGVQRLAGRADTVCVEGVGGWLVPLTDTATCADLATAMQVPVLIVAASRLGVINHTLLTLYTLASYGVTCPGFVFCGEDENAAENAASIARSPGSLPIRRSRDARSSPSTYSIEM